jgi:hypothetical protein
MDAVTSVRAEETCPLKTNQLSGYITAPEHIHWAADPCMSLIISALDGQRINLTLLDFSVTRPFHSTEQHDGSEVKKINDVK